MPKEKQLETYLDLCTQFYDLDKSLAPEQELAFYMDYAKMANGPILEPMCGTGRFLIPMCEAGFELDGFDASSFMLDALHKKCVGKNLVFRVWKQFLQDLDLEQRYDLIFIPSGSFGLVTDYNEATYCLQKIFQHLLAKGKFVFEVDTLKIPLEEMGAGNASVTRADGKRITLDTMSSSMVSEILSSTCKYQLLDGNNILKTEIEHFHVRLYDPDLLENLLRNVGFRHIKRLKAFDRNQEASGDDAVTVFECIK